MRFRPLLLLLILISSGCGPQTGAGHPFEKAYPAAGVTGIQIIMDRGQILVQGSTVDNILFSGETWAEIDPSTTTDGKTLVIDLGDSLKSDIVRINLPADLTLEIQAFDVDLELVSVEGNLTIRDTAGDIILEDFQGEARLWAGRGDITVRGGSGRLIVIGEHGNLRVEDFSGPATMTTIMGKIEYAGAVGNDGDVLLEVDHGPVKAILPEESDYRIEINSASGEIICQGGNLGRTIAGCAGSTGDGNGTLRIRTVSGRIEFYILSEKER